MPLGRGKLRYTTLKWPILGGVWPFGAQNRRQNEKPSGDNCCKCKENQDSDELHFHRIGLYGWRMSGSRSEFFLFQHYSNTWWDYFMKFQKKNSDIHIWKDTVRKLLHLFDKTKLLLPRGKYYLQGQRLK